MMMIFFALKSSLIFLGLVAACSNGRFVGVWAMSFFIGKVNLVVLVLVAQPEEQEISNLPVAGSIPAGHADFFDGGRAFFRLLT